MAKLSILLTILVILGTLSCIEGNTKFDDDLRDFMEFIKLQMQCGYPAAGVPPLAPYRADFKEFNIQGSAYSYKGNMSNLVVTGLNEFDVVDINWNNIYRKITFDFKFPSIQAKSSYKLNAVNNMFGPAARFWGIGLFDLQLINLRAYGSIKLKPSLSGGLAILSFKIKLDLESTLSKTTGIMNSIIYTKLFNSWFEEMIKVTFSETEAVSEAVTYLAVPPLNAALKNISVVELVALITGLANDVIPTEVVC